MKIFDDRRAFTKKKIFELDEAILGVHHLIDEKACIYATGSYGRLEATEHSDLDAFILGSTSERKDGTIVRNLSRLNEICVKASLIESLRKLNIADFDGDGAYLQHYTVDQLCEKAGTPEDDAENTFTARLLLLLESRCLHGEGLYDSAIEDIISHYWRDFADHSTDFMPAFLVNDILRLWRTFCVNYEARTLTAPHDKKIKRKIKNYKLKNSRLMTCYSSIIFLLHSFKTEKTVTVDKAKMISKLTPTERLINIAKIDASCRGTIEEIIGYYSKFLETTEMSQSELFDIFSEKSKSKRLLDNGSSLGDAVFKALNQVGDGTRFLRTISV